MAKLSVFLLLLLAYLLVISQAVPMEDISETDIDITETEISSSKESFLIDVTRTDLLVSDDGELLAERLESVMIDFELSDDQLLVNNVPVGLGVSDISVIEAKIIAGASNETLTDAKAEELDQDFDIGLVTVEVTTSAESLPSEDPTIQLRYITISIRIVEIDGVDIVQTDAVEKIFEVKTLEDGTQDVKLADMNTQTADPHYPCTSDTFMGRLRHWWLCSSRFTRIILTSIFLTSVFGIAFIALPTAAHAFILAARRRRATYHQVAIQEEDETIIQKSDQVIYVDEEKRALMLNQENKQ